ncbi:hypothetical protein FisN_33Lh063 [Fistulifera solaris]|uniref:Peptidase M50 domain-containing protein n=1 Tax=Fistulifera solaris TaxID=1519565 RepID=A0A1Z5KB57_FISSO|nr:hypothetical protein FisN_33Lh063 [Fistulifera solaris]|eukprot:GAX23168.1 hypothetical protein FisN_33Lh063 [Fistulifera solaris]
MTYDDMLKECPIAGFDEEDLALYIPVCQRLEEQMPNATDVTLMTVFRQEESLQKHFQEKVTKMIAEPLEDLQKMESLRSQYLQSTSRLEKDQLKREMKALERKQQSMMAGIDGVFLNLPPLTPERLKERLEAIEALPRTLRAVYMSRTGSTNTSMAIYLDYYDAQLQLLEQVPQVEGIDVMEVRRTVETLPYALQEYIAEKGGVADEWNIDLLVEKLMEKDEDEQQPANQWARVQNGGFSVTVERGDTTDIDYLDRSRYVSELYPALARMPSPSQTEVEGILQRVAPLFMVRSKPEKVVGGYYLRGENMISDDENGLKLSEKLEEVFRDTSMQCFYIQDPSPVSDENFEMGYQYESVIFVTSGNFSDLYRSAGTVEKVALATLSVFMVWVFAVAGCEMQPILSERIDQTLTEVNANTADLSWLLNILSPTIMSMFTIYVSHELGHKLIGWKDNLGILSSITPIKSPPPTLRSMFDFAIAGPLFGLLASFAFFITGLTMTSSSVDLSLFPAVPVYMLKASAVCGGFTEFYLGNGILEVGPTLPLHPYAISGAVGILANALALLPLGHTDGGRIALSMFGRRGAFVIKSFAALLICLSGLVGLDNSHIQLTYLLFAIIWQRELETPARNEVAEIDIVRGACGIAMALLVSLILLPAQ